MIFIVGVKPHDPIALAKFCPQLFGFSLGIVGDHCVGCIENRLRASIVLRQHNNRHLRKRRFKLQDISKIGAAKPIHRLVSIANHADIVMRRCQHHHDFVLRNVRVLIFVDQNVFEALLILRQHVFVLAKKFHGVDQQIIEVHRAGFQQSRLILAKNFCVFRVEHIVGVQQRLFWRDQFVLPQTDAGVHTARRKSLGV